MAVLGLTGRFEFLWLAIGQMVYAYFFVLRLRKGLPRAIALLPLLPPTLLVPWRAPTPPERTLMSFFFLWVISFRLLMLAWGRGPASDPSVLSSFPRFFSAMTLTVHSQRDNHRSTEKAMDKRIGKDAKGLQSVSSSTDSEGANATNGVRRRKIEIRGKLGGVQQPEEITSKENRVSSHWIGMVATAQSWPFVLLRCLFRLLLGTALVKLILAWKDLVPEYITTVFLGVLIYVACSFVFEALSVPTAFLGIQLQPQFNLPFLADSLADFWGRRWNLLVNNLLRVSVYETMLELLDTNGSKKSSKRPAPRDRALATTMTFLVSGLMHEVVFFYLNQTRPSWEVTAFFVLNGAATVLEDFIVKPREQHCWVPRLLRRVYTMSFLSFTAQWFFFPPIFRTGMGHQSLVEVNDFLNCLLRMIFPRPGAL